MGDAEQRWQQTPSVLATDLSDAETVMLDPDAAKYFGMTETGPAVWREFAEPSTVDDVVARLTERYDAPPGAIRADVETFVEQLRERKLLVAAD